MILSPAAGERKCKSLFPTGDRCLFSLPMNRYRIFQDPLHSNAFVVPPSGGSSSPVSGYDRVTAALRTDASNSHGSWSQCAAKTVSRLPMNLNAETKGPPSSLILSPEAGARKFQCACLREALYSPHRGERPGEGESVPGQDSQTGGCGFSSLAGEGRVRGAVVASG